MSGTTELKGPKQLMLGGNSKQGWCSENAKFIQVCMCNNVSKLLE